MTSKQFVKRYNQTAADHYFAHRISLSKETPHRLFKNKTHRVAGGGPISFLLTESGSQVQDITMFDSQASAPRHCQIESIAASIAIDVIAALPKAERKAVIEQLGLPTGQYGASVPIGPNYIATAKLIEEPPRFSLLLEFRYIHK